MIGASDHNLSAGIQVPGLNAPIPPGTQFGYQAGGWGKPPVNEEGEPLYGDVFGQFADEEDDEQPVDYYWQDWATLLASLGNPTGKTGQPYWQEWATLLARWGNPTGTIGQP
ncbi:MAG: hypothetical protein Q9216_005615 [Gyalolechia sp. 2 TL-2023]